MTRSQQEPDSLVRDHFDRSAALYVDKYDVPYRIMCQERLELLDAYLSARRKDEFTVLDIGCGAGVFMDMILDRYKNARVCCIDFSFEMLNRNARTPRKRLVWGDARILPFRPASFDIINLDALMHHLIDRRGYQSTIQRIKDFLISLDSLLKPDGIVMAREIYHEYIIRDSLGTRLIYTLSTAKLPAALSRLLRTLGLNTVNAGVCFLTRNQWRQVFQDCGYAVLSAKDKSWKPSPYAMAGFCRSGDLYFTLSRA